MSCYINRTNERLYGALEGEYGVASAVSTGDRLSFSQLKVSEEIQRGERRDKTGSRTRHAPHPELRSRNQFELDCYFGARSAADPSDATTTLVEAAMGGARVAGSVLTVSAVSQGGRNLSFATTHGLSRGQGVRFRGELRFVEDVPGAQSVVLSAAFHGGIQAGDALESAVTIWPGDKPKSLTLIDYWTPAGALDRVLAGCVTEEMTVRLNSDFHGVKFTGSVREVVAAEGFLTGSAGLGQFPPEPPVSGSGFRLVPGHVGRMYFGSTEFFLLDLSLTVRNNTDAVAREFGSKFAKCYSADTREVGMAFSLYASDDPAVRDLHLLARQQQPVAATIQLGNEAGQLVGVYVPQFIPSLPTLGEADSRVVMGYAKSFAFGVSNDELSIAFG